VLIGESRNCLKIRGEYRPKIRDDYRLAIWSGLGAHLNPGPEPEYGEITGLAMASLARIQGLSRPNLTFAEEVDFSSPAEDKFNSFNTGVAATLW
jgi:hypothetical protein